jgi:hypothetical protein
MAAPIDFGFGQPFKAQLEFFLAKLNLPTAAWDDIWQAVHDRAFIVAGALKADLLNDIGQLVAQSIAGQISYDQFHKQFLTVAQAHGWVDWKGNESEAGRAWRTRLVYSTNLTTSYAAGRYQQLTDPDFRERFPYWVYHHLDGQTTPRPLHESWDGLTLPWDHPFWQTHYPPNGWCCHCWVTATDEAGYQAAKEKGLTDPPEGWEEIDPKTGAPVGIDKGWAYAPGANANTPLADFIDQKLINLDAPIGAAMYAVLEPVLLAERIAAFVDFVDSVLPNGIKTEQRFTRGETFVVGALKEKWVDAAKDAGLQPTTAEIMVRAADVSHTFRTGKVSQLDLDWYKRLPELVQSPDAVLLDKTHPDEPAFLLIYSGPDKASKIVVRINYQLRKGKVGNIVETGKLVDLEPLRGSVGKGYQLIEGSL